MPLRSTRGLEEERSFVPHPRQRPSRDPGSSLASVLSACTVAAAAGMQDEPVLLAPFVVLLVDLLLLHGSWPLCLLIC